jgi:hypothetical protein
VKLTDRRRRDDDRRKDRRRKIDRAAAAAVGKRERHGDDAGHDAERGPDGEYENNGKSPDHDRTYFLIGGCG